MSFQLDFHSHLAKSIYQQEELSGVHRLLIVTTDQVTPGISGELAELANQIFIKIGLQDFSSKALTSIETTGASDQTKNCSYIIDGAGVYVTDNVDKLTSLSASEVPFIIGFGLKEKQERDALTSLRGTAWRLIEYDPHRYQAIVEDALEFACKTANFNFGPVTTTRYCSGGIAMVEHEAKMRGHDPDADTKYFCERVCRSWVYQENAVDPDRVFNWLYQLKRRGFENQGREILQYLMRYGYQRRQSVEEKLRSIYEKLSRADNRTIIPVAAQSSGKSEAFLAYYLRDRGGLLNRAIKLKPLSHALDEVHRENKCQTSHIVCFDDVIGSGGSVEKSLITENPKSELLIDSLKNNGLKVTQIAAFASPEGLEYIREKLPYGGFEVRSARVINLNERVFSDNSTILENSTQSEKFKAFCIDVGKKIYDPNNPLGWGNNNGWCLAFDYTVPNMTLPIIFQDGNADFEWQPLFPRYRTAPPISY